MMWTKVNRAASQRKVAIISALLFIAAMQFYLKNSHAVLQLWASVAHSGDMVSFEYRSSPLLFVAASDDSLLISGDVKASESTLPDPPDKSVSAPSQSQNYDIAEHLIASADVWYSGQPAAPRDMPAAPKNDSENESSISWITKLRSGELEIPSFQDSNIDRAITSLQKEDSASVEDTSGADNRTPEFISKIMSAQNETLQEFYRQELKINPNIKGYLDIRFTVVSAGNVSSAILLHSTLGSARVEQHVLQCIKNLDNFGTCDTSIGDKTYRQRYNFGCSHR